MLLAAKKRVYDSYSYTMNHPRDEAMYIYFQVQEGIYDASFACEQILNASGNRAMAIFYAYKRGWWNQSVEDTCRSIIDAPGDRSNAILFAKKDGWWVWPTQ